MYAVVAVIVLMGLPMTLQLLKLLLPTACTPLPLSLLLHVCLCHGAYKDEPLE
jgi:hypothetical protein